jgi:hypothetical protein
VWMSHTSVLASVQVQMGHPLCTRDYRTHRGSLWMQRNHNVHTERLSTVYLVHNLGCDLGWNDVAAADGAVLPPHKGAAEEVLVLDVDKVPRPSDVMNVPAP